MATFYVRYLELELKESFPYQETPNMLTVYAYVGCETDVRRGLLFCVSNLLIR